MSTTGARVRERLMLVVAAGLVVVLGVDPGLSGSAWSWAAQAAGSGVIDESRAQNYAVADATLDPETPALSAPLVNTEEEADQPPVPLELPAVLPTPAETVVDLTGAQAPGAGIPVEVGGLSVTVAPVDGEASPEQVSLKVLDQAATAQAGVTGVLLEVTDASATPTPGAPAVELSVSYDGFAGIGGGDWASRLQAMWVPDCDPADEATAACRPVPLDGSHDEVAQTVNVTVPVNAAAPAGVVAPARLGATTTTAAAAAGSGGSVAITSGVAGPLGDWSASPLALSSTWGTTGATGAFTWSYPMRVPQVPAGPAPELSLSYNSAVSDGRVASTNNQAGLVGEGFDLGASFIERTYRSCAEDETAGANNVGLSAPDLCWGLENATLSLGGSGTELVKDETTGTWHPKRDDGTRIEHVTSGGAEGEYWKVTTTDGTQYFFGRDAAAGSAWTVPVYGNHPDEPGHQAEFKNSSLEQVWRWNLDRVVDPSGNTASYFYTTETNQYRPFYGTEAVSYVAGGHLDRVEYGTHPDDGVTQAPAKVEFTHTPRCITDLAAPGSWCGAAQTATTANHWPDTPVDLICEATAGCETHAPTFFNRTRLATITTYAHDGSGYLPVDSWALSQRFVPQGDGIGLEYATGIMLRLDAVTHTGQGGPRDDVTLPAVEFDYTALKNRVEVADTGADALYRHRVTSVRTESGGRISVTYTTRCVDGLTADPAVNTDLCFPVKWHQPGEPDPRTDYFSKYVVDTVVEGHTNLEPASPELITGSLAVTTRYDYGQAAWKWVKPDSPLIDDADKTYSEFRGARQVTTLTGDPGTAQAKTVTTYYRGTGQTLTAPTPGVGTTIDRERYTGEVFTSTVFNGAARVSETVTVFGDPVTLATSAQDATFTATRIPSQEVHTATYDAAGGLAHHTRTATTFNEYSQPITVDDRGDVSTATDDLCTTTTYAHEADTTLEGRHLVALPAAVETVSTACDQQPDRPTGVVTASKVTYDTAGRPTKTEMIDPDDGDGYIQTSTVMYDTRGRATATKDAAGQATTTGYTHSAGGLVAETVTTNPLGHVTTTRFDPILEVPVSSTDANGRTTTGSYDGLGRLTAVTYPQHVTGQFPSVVYEYTVQPNGLNAVVTKTISADGNRQHASAVLYDGLMRPFQTQAEGRSTGTPDLGRMVTHTIYDSAGRVVKQTEPWWVQDAVSAVPESPPADTSGHTTFEYDGAGRQTAQIFWVGTDSNPANEKWRTTTHYDGDTALQIPPMGGTPTETTVDARGRTTELTQYHRDPDTDTTAVTPALVLALPNPTTTAYAYDAAGRLTGMTDNEDNAWSYGYDWAGRQITASDPDAGDTTTTYDVLGQVTTRTNGNGQTLGYTYDALGRTTSVRDGSPTGAVRASWEYDTLLKGVLTAATRTVDGQQYVTRTDAWDTAYRPTQTSLVLPNTGAFTNLQTRTLSTKYTYTVDGQTAAVTYPAIKDAAGKTILGAETVTTVYDPASSMPSWMSGGFGWGTYVAGSRFAADGRPLLADLGNTYGAVVSYRYEPGTKRLAGIGLDRERINGTELNLAYAYDPAGNVTSITDAPTSPDQAGATFQDTQCFAYDGLARLQTAWTPGNADCTQAPSAGAMGGAAPYWTNTTYDVLGNRTKQTTTAADGTATTTTYTHGAGAAGPHQVTTATTAGAASTFGYDAAGNRTSVETGGVTTGYTWDAEGELTQAGDVSNVYDADGNRIVRTDPDGTTVYAGGQEIHIGPDGAVKATRYYSFAGTTVAVRTDRGLGNGVTSLVSDHHGTPVAAIPNGAHPATTPIDRLYTDPFGATRGTSDADTIPGDTQFLGKTRDQATGLTQIGARYYDEALGAFISLDPLLDLTDPQQWNGYAYASNNPASRSDPTGLRVTDIRNDRETYWERVRQEDANAADQARVTNAYKSARGLRPEVVPAVTSVPCVNEGTCEFTPDFSNLGEMAHGALDVIGLFPVVGEIADGANALWCLAENDMLCAGLSAAAMIPFVGWGATAGKGAKTANDIVAGFGDTAALEARANVVHGALDPIAQNSRTTAALGTQEGQTVLASGGRDLSPAQRALAQDGEIIARTPEAHAEVTAVNGARSAGLTPLGIGVSRPICQSCQAFLVETGATITGPTTARWLK